MNNLINIEEFRKYYDEMVRCKETLNKNADVLNGVDKKRVGEALLPIIDDYGGEMVKRQIAAAILQNFNNYDETVQQWADNVQIPMFIYETEQVQHEYIPDRLSETAVQTIAKELIENEKNREIIVSREGTEYEVVKSEENYRLLCHRAENVPLYSYVSLFSASDGYLPILDSNVCGTSFLFTEANTAYLKTVEEERQERLAIEKLTKEYTDFKEAMTEKSSLDVYEACYRIAAMEDVYFYLTESKILTPEEREYILNTSDSVLTGLAQDWYEYEDNAEEIADMVRDCLEQYMQADESQKICVDEDENSEELE